MQATLVGGYTVIATLGRGGMADVYLAARRGPEDFTKLVVIKRLRAELAAPPEGPRYRALLLDEARLAARLHHPNIVQTFEVDDGDGAPWMTMEYLDGKSISHVMRTVRRAHAMVPRALAVRVIAEVLAALDYAHHLADYDGRPLAIVHRDVSPQNIFWTYDGAIKLVDFGVAKSARNATETEAGLVKGKVSYMAPEQARAERVDARADVFAVGVVLWEMLAGRRLFRAPTQAAALHALLYAPIPSLVDVVPDLDPRLAAICARALARDRDARYPDAATMRADLEAVLADAAPVGRDQLASFVRHHFAAERAQVSQLIRAALVADGPPIEVAPADELGSSAEISVEPSLATPTVSLHTPSRADRTPPRRRRPWLAAIAAVALVGAVAGGAVLASATTPTAAPIVTPIAAAVVTPAPAHAPSPPALRLCGSNTIGAELAPALVQAFLARKGASDIARRAGADAEHARVTASLAGVELAIDIRARGTKTAFEGLGAGDCDLGMASRAIDDAEIGKLAAAGTRDPRSPATEHVIALDGIAVVVHPDNPLRALDRPALHDVFTGKITDWAQLGGRPGPITVYARDDKSGTYDTFKHLVLDGGALVSGAHRLTASDALADAVATDPSAIGFIGLAYVRSAKAIAIGDAGVAPRMPTAFTVTTEDYLLARRLYFYTPATPRTPLVAELVAFALSPAGQQVVRDTGFVDLAVAFHDGEPCDARCPLEYARAIAGARRVSLDFRFREGSDTIDSRATRDLDRLTQAMRAHAGAKLYLFGFSDGSGDRALNVALSRQRVRTIADELTARGLVPTLAVGLGPARPVASNATAAGRERNRRVEVWLAE